MYQQQELFDDLCYMIVNILQEYTNQKYDSLLFRTILLNRTKIKEMDSEVMQTFVNSWKMQNHNLDYVLCLAELKRKQKKYQISMDILKDFYHTYHHDQS